MKTKDLYRHKIDACLKIVHKRTGKTYYDPIDNMKELTDELWQYRHPFLYALLHPSEWFREQPFALEGIVMHTFTEKGDHVATISFLDKEHRTIVTPRVCENKEEVGEDDSDW